MNSFRLVAIAAASGALLTAAGVGPAFAAGPEIVAGPAADAVCFVPWTDKTKFFKYPAKRGLIASRSPMAISPTPGASR